MDDTRITIYLTPNQKIRLFRFRKRMSQIDLGAEVGLSRQTLSNYETGKSGPRFDEIVELAKALGVSIQEIAAGEINVTSAELKYLKGTSNISLAAQRFIDKISGKVEDDKD